MKLRLLIQEEPKVGATSYLVHSIKGDKSIVVMTEDLKVSNGLSSKGYTTIRDFKKLSRHLDSLDISKESKLAIDSIAMLKEKEIKWLVNFIKCNADLPLDLTIVACAGSKHDAKKYALFSSLFNSQASDVVALEEFSIRRESNTTCVFSSGKCIKDITDIVKYGVVPLLR